MNVLGVAICVALLAVALAGLAAAAGQDAVLYTAAACLRPTP